MTGAKRAIRAWRPTHAEGRLTAANIKEALEVDDLCMADLSLADLSGADLSGENLYAANFAGANVRQADLSGTNLCFANFSGAYLRWATLANAHTRGANFSHSYLSDSDLHGMDLSRARLRGAMLPGILTIEGSSGGDAQLVPTPAGWHLRVGSRSGLLDEFVEQYTAESADLGAIIELCRAHVARNQGLDKGFPHTQSCRRPQDLANSAA